ncbi:LysR family transcriptional regulator [Alicyclobacillus dauci]|uniref:LysR family transcriptional regulator n=1 Tax=Alicyclobacillus dauci TaxID=1475485 RepID=A0ABY6Z6X3_9BACL|nr:LysR family transcriptional regulator [Alicyclobacillus dauci]WAH37775.1 LysR family transcriptional regulator [Alicyclobacillus dauci]
MEFRLLEYFMAVCAELHFTRAAERLGISQPTLSHQIRLLEDRLGTALFQRIGKKIYLSQSGKILQAHCEKIFYELEQAQAEIQELNGLHRGKLTIGCSGNHLVTRAIISFHELYPGIELSIVDLSTEETVEGLLKNTIDLGVTFLSIDDDRLEFIPLFKEELRLVVSSSNPLVNLQSVPFRDLQAVPIALLPKKYLIRRFIDACCRKVGFELSPKLELSSLESLREMIDNTLLASIMPQSYVASVNDPVLCSIPFTDSVPIAQVGIVYRKEAFMDVTTKSLIRHLTATLADPIAT